MAIPLELTFRDMTSSESVTDTIHRWLSRLEKVHQRIERATVVVERPHHSQRHGQGFHVRIELAMPDHVVNVAHDPGNEAAHTNVYTAIGDAFRAAKRQLQDHARIQRGDVKTHA